MRKGGEGDLLPLCNPLTRSDGQFAHRSTGLDSSPLPSSRSRQRAQSLGALLGSLALAVVGAACGGDDDGSAGLPLVGDIGPAVEALEAELGQPPQYYEIHATPLSVTLWVSADEGRNAIPYVYAGGELADPAGAQEVENGVTFAAADALTFDADQILDQVEADLDDSTLTEFSIVGGEGGAVRLGAVAQSERGGRLDIRLSPDGTPIEATAID